MIRKFSIYLFTAAALLITGCKSGTTSAPKSESYYETLSVSLSDRVLSTGYSAAISGVQTVEIRPQVSGMITEILIEEGESVRKGQVLFVIDQTPYKAAHEIAVANVKVPKPHFPQPSSSTTATETCTSRMSFRNLTL